MSEGILWATVDVFQDLYTLQTGDSDWSQKQSPNTSKLVTLLGHLKHCIKICKLRLCYFNKMLSMCFSLFFV